MSTHARGLMGRVNRLHRRFALRGAGWQYRGTPDAAPVAVSLEEREAFLADADRATGWHLAALALAAIAAWLVAERLLPGATQTMVAALFAFLASLAGIALHLSFEHAMRAPDRALAGRMAGVAVRPAKRPRYTVILGVVLLALFAAAMATRQPPGVIAALIVFAMMGGAYMAVRTWAGDRRLSPDERHAARAATRADPQAPTAGRVIAVLSFLVVEFVALVGGFLIGFGVVASMAGVAYSMVTGWTLAFAIVAGGTVGLLLVWPIDRLCRRWTGESAFDLVSSLPPSW